MINIVVKLTSSKFAFKPRLEEANTLGINKKIIKGLATPPVK